MQRRNPSRQKPRKSEINVLRSIQKIEFRCSGYQQGITVTRIKNSDYELNYEIFSISIRITSKIYCFHF